MLVVIANNLPPAVRGRMKLWFVEPRANVFVSGVKDSVARSVIDYLFESCPARSGLLIFHVQPFPQIQIQLLSLQAPVLLQTQLLELAVEIL